MNFDTQMIVILVAVLAAAIVAFLLLRPRRQRIAREQAPTGRYEASRERAYSKAREGAGVPGEVAAATADVAGEMLGVSARASLSGEAGTGGDLLEHLKGVGPRLAAKLRELGISRFDELATMSEAEIGLLDERLGAFRGRLARDRVAEQAQFLARGDRDGFEAKFGRLGEA